MIFHGDGIDKPNTSFQSKKGEGKKTLIVILLVKVDLSEIIIEVHDNFQNVPEK